MAKPIVRISVEQKKQKKEKKKKKKTSIIFDEIHGPRYVVETSERVRPVYISVTLLEGGGWEPSAVDFFLILFFLFTQMSREREGG